jgi:hypothetical protein
MNLRRATFILKLFVVISIFGLFIGCGGSGGGSGNNKSSNDQTGESTGSDTSTGGNSKVIGNWVLINFLPDDTNGEWEEDDTSGIGFTLVVTDTTWVEQDQNSSCKDTFSYSVGSDLKYKKIFVSSSGSCPYTKLPNETGHLEFQDDGKIMIEYFDLLPGDEILAFKWMKQ